MADQSLSLLQIDNNKVGIGTARPVNKLHIVGDNGDQLRLDNDGDQWSQLNFANNGSDKAFMAFDNTNKIITIGAQGNVDGFDYIGFRPKGSVDVMAITGSRVGIGTTDPEALLHLKGGSWSNTMTLQSSGTVVGIAFTNSSNTPNGYIYAANTGQIGFLDDDAAWAIRHVTDNYTDFRINNTSYMYLNTTGLAVGNGHTPSYALDVKGGSARMISTGNTFALYFAGSDGDSDGAIYSDTNQFGLLDGDGAWFIQHTNDTSTGFRINNTQYMQLTTSGLSLGVGQSGIGLYLGNSNSRIYFGGARALEGGSSGTLQVGEGFSTLLLQGNTTVQGNMVVTGTLTAQEFITELNTVTIIESSGSTKFGNTNDDIHQFTGSLKLKGTADLGSGGEIKTSKVTGTSPLSISAGNDVVSVTGSLIVSGTIAQSRIGTNNFIAETGGTTLLVGSGSQHGFQFINDGAAYSSTPANKKTILKLVNNAIGLGAQYNNGIEFSPYGNKAYAGIYFYWHGDVSNGRMEFRTTTDTGGSLVTAMIMDESQQIGIGNTNPEERLHLTDGKLKIDKSNGNAGDTEIHFDRRHDGADARIQVKGGASGAYGTEFHFVTTQAGVGEITGMVIDDYQRVGIGTNDPGSKLELWQGVSNGSNYDVIKLDADTGNYGGMWIAGQWANGQQGRIGFWGNGTSPGNRGVALIGDGGTTPMVFLNSGGQLGVNTTSPKDSLHVMGASGEGDVGSTHSDSIALFQNNVNASDQCYITLVAGTTGGAGIHFGDKDDTDAGIIKYDLYAPGGGGFEFHTEGSEKMSINANGNVGIGTSVPSNLLTLRPAGGKGLTISGSNTRFEMRDDNGYQRIESGVSTSNSFASFIQMRSIDNVLTTQLTAGGADSYISSGSFAIGDTSPLAKLHVEIASHNDAVGFYNGSTALVYMRNEAGTGRLTLQGSGGTINLESSNSRNSYINTSANFGIGTSSPTGGKLHVAGNIYATGTLETGTPNFNLSGTSLYGYAYGLSSFVSTGGGWARAFRWYNNVNATARQTTFFVGAIGGGSGTSYGYLAIGDQASESTGYSFTKAIRLYSDGDVTIPDGGLAIGHTSPNFSLDVRKSTSDPVAFFGYSQVNAENKHGLIVIQSGTIPQSGGDLSGEAGIIFRHSGGTGGSNFDGNAGSIKSLKMDTYAATGQAHNRLVFSTTFDNTDSEKMTILDSGNVGIGTPSPGRKFVVSTGSDTYALIETTSGNNDCWLKFDNTGDADGTAATSYRIGRTHDGRFDIGAGNGNHHMSVLSDGKVGIGEPAPIGHLHVVTGDSGHTGAADVGADELVIEGSGDTGLSILSPAGNKGGIYFTRAGQNTAGSINYHHVNDSPANAMVFSTAATTAMTIDSAQRVGIGDPTPTAQLEVARAGNEVGRFYNTTTAGTTFLRLGAVKSLDTNVYQIGGMSARFVDSGWASATVDFIGPRSTGYGDGVTYFSLNHNGTNQRVQFGGSLVGINTANPGFPLDVNGTGRFQDVLRLDSSLNFNGSQTIGTVGQSDSLSISPDANLHLGVSSTDHIYIGASGRNTTINSTTTTINNTLAASSITAASLTFSASSTGAVIFSSSDEMKIIRNSATLEIRSGVSGAINFFCDESQVWQIDDSGDLNSNGSKNISAGGGNITTSGKVQGGDGSATTPGLCLGGTNDGFYHNANGINVHVANATDFLFADGGTFHADADVIAYTTTISDKRVKDDIIQIENPLEKVQKLRGVEFVWNKGSRKDTKDIGVIAQEIEKVIPEIVHEKEMPLLDDSGEKYKTVDYDKLTALLIESVKEQQKQIEELKSEIQELKDGSSK